MRIGQVLRMGVSLVALAVLKAGQTFAEAPVFSGGTYPANSECVEDCEVIHALSRAY